MNHLEGLESLRESVGIRAYGQHDPLIEYRRESHILYKEMMANFDKWLEENKEKIEEMQKNPPAPESNLKPAGAVSNKKIGRNDPCWCGSGKKYKKCHGS